MTEKPRKIWDLWQKYKIASAESLSQSIEKKFAAVSEAVSVQIRTDAARFSRLGDADENIFSHLAGLMGVYRRVVKIAAENEFEDEDDRALVAGICEVLSSRLREFDEATARQGAENPISAEKKAIIDEVVKTAAAAITQMKENFATGLRDGDGDEWDESFEMILRGDFYEMFSCYRSSLKESHARLDDLFGRSEARFYTELIEREWEVLSNISACGTASPETHDGSSVILSKPDSAVVISIFDALREAHQQTGPVVEDLQSLLASSQKKPPAHRTFDDFENELLAALADASPKPPEFRGFIAGLDAEVMLLLDALATRYKKAAYALQRAISEEVLLSEEVTGVFEKTLSDMPPDENDADDAPDPPDIERGILRGIRETLEIKIAGMKESIQSFVRQSGDILKDFSAEREKVPDGERAAIIEGVRAAWLENPPDEENLDDFFEKMQSGDVFAPCRERVEKQAAVYTELLEKSSLRFKKEVLLYEICTFEEILTHSVSRLRESADNEVLAAAAMLDETFRALEVILKKNNISVIRPAAHEHFDAKEHEVLVAEKMDGFEKGEIIKIVTAGYRYKEQVILRANVIAAR